MHWQERYQDFREALAGALDPVFYTAEYLDWLLHSGAGRIWFSDHAAIVAEIKVFPTGARIVQGFVAAGKRREIVELIAQAEAWGHANGCIRGAIDSREAWAKLAAPLGYRPYKYTLMKDL